MKYKEKFIEFFLSICSNKSIEMRRNGAYNLPCFYALYKEQQAELGIDF